MTNPLPPSAMASVAIARNRDFILEVLKLHLPQTGFVLEIAAGTGEHTVHNAAVFPGVQWQPTDPDPAALASIAAWRDHTGLPNVLPPLTLDASEPDAWPIESADAVININMIHISPWSATEGLMKGASRVLKPDGLLFLYGPYLERDIDTAASNLAFDRSLRARDAAWGLRQLEDVIAVAREQGLELTERVAMPANNLSLLFRKS